MTPNPEIKKGPEVQQDKPFGTGPIRSDVEKDLTDKPKEQRETETRIQETKAEGAKALEGEPENKSKFEAFMDKIMGYATLFSLFMKKMMPGNMVKSLEENEYKDLNFSDEAMKKLEHLSSAELEKEIPELVLTGDEKGEELEQKSIMVAGKILGNIDTSDMGESLKFCAHLKNSVNANGDKMYEMKDDFLALMGYKKADAKFTAGTVFVVNRMPDFKALGKAGAGKDGMKIAEQFAANSYQLVFVATGRGNEVRGFLPGTGVVKANFSDIANELKLGFLGLSAVLERKASLGDGSEAAAAAEAEAAKASEAAPVETPVEQSGTPETPAAASTETVTTPETDTK